MPIATHLDHFNLRTFDLNLLVAFDALMRERSVTRAARRLRIGQPAMSQSLASLRMLLDDALFVRSRNGMQPTTKAVAVAAHVAAALGEAQRAILLDERFDPLTSARVFTIGISCEDALTIPALGAMLTKAAPSVAVNVRRLDVTDIGEALDARSVDAVIGCTVPRGERFRSDALFDQPLACCYSRAQIRRPWERGLYFSLPHVLISPDKQAYGCVDTLLRKSGYALKRALVVPDYLTALGAVAAAPLLTTLPYPVATRFGRSFDLDLQPAPVNATLPQVRLIWLRQAEGDDGARWLIETIRTAIETDQARDGTESP